MGLTLLAGPANAGKVALLLDRYLADISREPVLIVPNRSDVERVERDLLGRCGALLGGSIGTFDDLFERIAAGNGGARGGRRRCAAGAAAPPRGRLDAARRSRPLGALLRLRGRARDDDRRARVRPARPGRSRRRPRRALPRATAPSSTASSLWDADLRRRYAADRRRRRPRGLGRPPGLRLRLRGPDVRRSGACSRRSPAASDVTVSLPYEPARPAFAALERTAADLARLAAGSIEELPPRYAEYAHPALAHLERALFSDVVPRRAARRRRDPLPRGGRLARDARARRRRGARPDPLRHGARGDPRRLPLARPGARAARDGVRRARRPVRAGRRRSACRRRRSAGRCCRCCASPGSAAAAATCSGSSARRYSGLPRAHADFLEGRLRGRGVRSPERVEEEMVKLRGQPLAFLDRLRAGLTTTAAVRELAGSMLRAAYGLDAPPATEPARLDLRTYQAVLTLMDELEGWRELGGELSAEELVGTLERAPVRAGPAREGHVAVLDLLRARTRQAEIVFVLGLEEGSLPRRSRTVGVPRRRSSPRARRQGAARQGRPGRPRPLSLLHRVHARLEAPVPRPRGGDRRRRAAPAEPVLGRRAGRSRSGRRGALDDQARALRARLADRGRSDRPRAGALARVAGER